MREPKDESGTTNAAAWMTIPSGTHWRQSRLFHTGVMTDTRFGIERWTCRHGHTSIIVVADNRRLDRKGIVAWIRSQEQAEDFVAFMRGRLGYEEVRDLVAECRRLAEVLPDRMKTSHDHDDEHRVRVSLVAIPCVDEELPGPRYTGNWSGEMAEG